MKLSRVLICWLLLASPSLAANVYFLEGGPVGLTNLYVRVDVAGTMRAVALTEGSSGDAGNYYVTEANLVSASVNTASSGDGFRYRVFAGSTPSTTAADAPLAFGRLKWSGSAELSETANMLATTNGGATVATQLAYLDSSVSSAGGGTSIAAFDVDASHEYQFSPGGQILSPTEVTEYIGYDSPLGFNFGPLVPRTVIATVDATSITPTASVTEPTLGTATLSPDRKKVLLPIDTTGCTAGEYTISITFTTSDSRTFVRKATFTIE